MQTNDPSSTNTETPGNQDQIKVKYSVVASIVRLASLDIQGVYSVGGGFVDDIAGAIFSKKSESDRGVKVSEDEEGNYVIEIRIFMDFGIELAKTAQEVQTAVREQVSVMTGNSVSKIDVIIEGVKKRGEAPESNEADWTETHPTD
ncbi:MAG: Asp23/Gls24 family envelope stress response protein [Opitutaceae bacterium]|nr:Asp23/Gls24 family envelope stress response protein [Opitutaceae bacterium]